MYNNDTASNIKLHSNSSWLIVIMSVKVPIVYLMSNLHFSMIKRQ